jgi:predicted phosphodiesterase
MAGVVRVTAMIQRESIRILHLSDIQYGRHHVDREGRPPLYPDADYTPQLDKLIDDLEIIKEKAAVVPNFIVVTGDIAEWSRQDEYVAAENFLGGLVKYLQIDRRRVILVPGNHDINRDLCQAARLTAKAEGASFDPRQRMLRMALMDHNFIRASKNDQENLKDADDLKPLLMAGRIRLVLHGHQHFPRQEVTGQGDQVIHVLATGSAGLDGDVLPDTPRRYQVIELDGPVVGVYRRFFDNTHQGPSGQGCWKADLAPHQSELFDRFTLAGGPEEHTLNETGEDQDTCPIPPKLTIPPAYQHWVRDKCGHMDVDKLRKKGSAITVSLPEVFIPLYANPPGGAKADQVEDPKAVDIETLIAQGEDLLIAGEAGSGKTTLVKHFVFKSIQDPIQEPGWQDLDGVLPVLIFLKDLRGFQAADANQDAETAQALLQQSFSKSGCGLDVETVFYPFNTRTQTLGLKGLIWL